MRVIIDISVLGQGHYFAPARTGIFRYIENIVLAIDDHTNVEVSYSAGPNLDDYFRCYDYLLANNELKIDKLIVPDVNSRITKLYSKIFYWLTRREKSTIIVRLVRFLYRLAKQLLMVGRVVNVRKIDEYDVYHATFSPPSKVILRETNIGIVQTLYDLIPILYPQYCEKASIELLNNVINSIDQRVFCLSISESTKNDLLKVKKISPQQVRVTPLAASSKFYPCKDLQVISEVRGKLSIPNGNYVLSLSTLEPRKNIVSVIKSFNRLVNDGKVDDLNLVLAGTKGWNYDEIFHQLEINPETAKRVIVTGYVNDSDLAPLYSGARMFVYPSFYEGFGLPPLEAMQCGVPVVTSNVSSLPEVVSDAGIMVNPQDIHAISEAMWRIYSDPELASDMSRKGIKRSAEFNWGKCVQMTLMSYEGNKRVYNS